MSKLSLKTVSSGYYSAALLNENFKRIEGYLEMLVSRYGNCPNHMEANLNMNGFDILNVGTLTANRVVVTGDLNIPGLGYEELVERRSTTTILEQCTTLMNTPDYYQGNGSLTIFVDGLKQIKDYHYTELSPTQILFSKPQPAGSVVEMVAGLTLFASEELMANRKVITLGRDSSYNVVNGGDWTLTTFNKVLRDDLCTLSDGAQTSIVVPAGYRYAKIIGSVGALTYTVDASGTQTYRPVGLLYYVVADNYTQAELGSNWTNYATINGVSNESTAPGGVLGAYQANVVTPFMPVNPGDELGIAFYYRYTVDTSPSSTNPGLTVRDVGTYVSVEFMP